MARQRILIVEDEEHLLTFYRETLERAGYKPYVARTGKEALSAFAEAMPDLIILDVGLSEEMDGFEVLAVLRMQRRSDVPIMILTAQVGESKIIRGLNLGADNYVLKPVSGDQLVARVRAQLGRSRSGERTRPTGVYHYGDLVIDLDRNQATRRGTRFTFGDTERQILARLLQSPGQPVTHQELMLVGWGYTGPLVKSDDMRVLLSCIYRLRDKLEKKKGHSQRLIETVPEVGFSILPPESDSLEAKPMKKNSKR
jgi:DNA-binding response OmpR family regulator